MSSLVLRRVSCRTGSVLGVVMFAVGLAVTSFATELWHTFLTFGILTGSASNLLVVADYTHLGRWFQGRSYAKASALALVGTSAGEFYTNCVSLGSGSLVRSLSPSLPLSVFASLCLTGSLSLSLLVSLLLNLSD